jgi:hypothetical protein
VCNALAAFVLAALAALAAGVVLPASASGAEADAYIQVAAPQSAQNAPGVVAQDTPVIELRGRGDPAHDRYIRELLADGPQLIITQDTVIMRNDTVPMRVLVVGATLRLDGVVLGDLVGVGANLFIRPSASVTGAIRNIAGGLYRSELSSMAGPIENEPNAQYEIERRPGVVTIRGLEHPSLLELPGIYGFGVPSYDRVSGLTLRWGAGLVLPRIGEAAPFLRGWGSYYSQRGDFGGGGELAVERGWTEVAAGAERTTLTNEEWIRSDLSNSVAMLLQGKDYRNYYSADRRFVRIARTLEKGARTSSLTLTGQVEDASPLRAAQPWSFLKPDSIRPNHYGFTDDSVARRPDGRITSAIARFETEWEHPQFILDAHALAELGSTALKGSADFARFELGGDIAMAALSNHTLEFEWRFQGPLPGTDSLPFARWSYVGGSGTLHTFPVAAFSGDRIAFVETMYTIPLPERMRLPLLGTPALDLLHYVAMAWTHDEQRRFEQNVGARLGYRIAYVRVVTNPRHFADDVKVSFGLTLPRKTYPWSERR